MSKIILTKKQAEFIEGFKELEYDSKKVEITEELPLWASYALNNLTQFSISSGLLNAKGKRVSDVVNDEEGNFQHDQVPLLIEAIMHGYEVEKDKIVILYIEFSDFNEYGNIEKRKIYYGVETHVTSKFLASLYNLNIEHEKEEVEKLKAQGWKVEEFK